MAIPNWSLELKPPDPQPKTRNPKPPKPKSLNGEAMFTDWLDAGPLDYSSLAGAFAPWARGAASDAQAYPCRYLGISIVSVVEIVGFPWIRDSKPPDFNCCNDFSFSVLEISQRIEIIERTRFQLLHIYIIFIHMWPCSYMFSRDVNYHNFCVQNI